MLIEALIIAPGLPANGFRLDGPDIESMAFFRNPGIEKLYSGVTIRKPSEFLIEFLNFSM
jgi:hypothetical protein